MSTSEVYVIDAVRTPVGKIAGALAHVRPDDMAAATISSLMERTPDLDPTLIDDVHFGNGNGAGEENRNVARLHKSPSCLDGSVIRLRTSSDRCVIMDMVNRVAPVPVIPVALSGENRSGACEEWTA